MSYSLERGYKKQSSADMFIIPFISPDHEAVHMATLSKCRVVLSFVKLWYYNWLLRDPLSSQVEQNCLIHDGSQ